MSTTEVQGIRLDVGQTGHAKVDPDQVICKDDVKDICWDIAWELGKQVGEDPYDGVSHIRDDLMAGIRWQAVVTDKALGDTGRLAKRIKKFIKRRWSVNPNERVCKAISDTISYHSPTDFWYEVADHFDWDDGDFGDEGSCFWGCHQQAKEELLGLGCRTLLLFGEEDEVGCGTGIGRCIIVPDAPELGCHILFNAYGPCLETVGKAMARHLKTDWETITLYGEPGERASNLIYVNNKQGLVLGKTSHRSYTISDEVYIKCPHCEDNEDYMAESETRYDEETGEYYCQYHYDELMCQREEEEELRRQEEEEEEERRRLEEEECVE